MIISKEITKSKITKSDKELALKKIKKLYQIALFFYFFPFLYIVWLVIDSNLFHVSDLLTFVFFLLSILPLSIAGLISNILGLHLSRKINHIDKKNIGYADLLIGISMFVSGLFGLAIPFVMALE